MANEFKHGTVGTELTQAEYEAVGGHVVDSQATGDIVYASSSSQLIRLGIGSTNDVLMVKSGIPDWEAQTQITSVGTIATGTWQATDIGVAYGGTGVSTLLTNAVLTGNGTSAIQAETTLLFSSNKLIPTASAHDAAGTVLTMSAGATTAGTTNNIAGGALTFQGGQGKGSGAGGDIIFQTANAGGSGSSLNALATALTISDDLSATFAGSIVGTLGTAAQGNITSLGTLTTLTVDNVIINGTTIGHTSDSDLMTLADGTVNISGKISINDSSPGQTFSLTELAETNIIYQRTYSDTTGQHNKYYFIKSHSDSFETNATTLDTEVMGEFKYYGVNGAGTPAQTEVANIKVQQQGTAGATYNAADMIFSTSSASTALAEKMRIRETGAVQIGGAGIAQRSTSVLDLNASNTYPRLSVTSWSASDYPAYLQLSQSQNDTMGTKTATADGAVHGYIRFEGVDSAGNFDLGCSISSQQDGSAGTRVPANLIFTTSTSSSPTEKMRIMGTGLVGIGTNAPDHLLTLTSSVATSQIELRGAGIAGGGGFFTNYGNQNCVMSAGVRANAGSWTADTTAGGGSGAAAIYNQQNSTHYWYSNGSLTDGSNYSPAQVFTIVLGGDATLAGTLTESSDARLKTNISTIGSALDKVVQMRGVTYDRTDFDKSGVGLVAQELEQIAPELVLDNDEYKSVAYTKLTAYLIEAIKELNNEIKELKGN